MKGNTMQFKPMNSSELVLLVNGIVATNADQQTGIQTALLQATYHTFASDYRFAGKDGAPDYDAPHLNLIMDMMEKARGVDVHAVAKWITAFAPVQFEKSTGYFTLSKQKVDKLALYLIEDEEERANAFWAWATTASAKAMVTGKDDATLYAPTLNWYELDGATRSRAKAEFGPDSIESRIESLIKACVKAGYDQSAELLAKVKAETVAAAKLKEAEHLQAAA